MHSNPPARGGWDRSVAGCRVRIMVCDTARRPGVGDCDACPCFFVLASCFLKRMPSKVFLCDGSANKPERYEQGVLPAGVQKRAARVGKDA
jgi:hypothetical protein